MRFIGPWGQSAEGWEPEAGGKLGRRKAEIAAVEHGGCEAVHDGVGLHMEVAEHFVGFPPADHS